MFGNEVITHHWTSRWLNQEMHNRSEGTVSEEAEVEPLWLPLLYPSLHPALLLTHYTQFAGHWRVLKIPGVTVVNASPGKVPPIALQRLWLDGFGGWAGSDPWAIGGQPLCWVFKNKQILNHIYFNEKGMWHLTLPWWKSNSPCLDLCPLFQSRKVLCLEAELVEVVSYTGCNLLGKIHDSHSVPRDTNSHLPFVAV